MFKEMIICLVKIRNGFDNQHLSFLFSVSVGHILKIVIAWVNLLHQCLKDLFIWPSKETVKGNLPLSFNRFLFVPISAHVISVPSNRGTSTSMEKTEPLLGLLGGISSACLLTLDIALLLINSM